MILDTNVLLYHVQDKLVEPLSKGVFAVSFITEIEVLSFPDVQADEEAMLRTMFGNDVRVMELTPAIKELAITIRKRHRLKLPDAIIAATAMELGVELVTNDRDLAKVTGLKSRSVILLPGG